MIRLQVRTDTINRQIEDSIGSILRTASAIALAAIALGILGAIIMASITVTPIRRLARGVAVIRDTEDKETLKDHTHRRGHSGRDRLPCRNGERDDARARQGRHRNKLLLAGHRRAEEVPAADERHGGRGGQHGGGRERPAGDLRVLQGRKGRFRRLLRFQEAGRHLLRPDQVRRFRQGCGCRPHHGGGGDAVHQLLPDWPKRKENISQLKDPKAQQRAIKELERLDPLVYTINDMVEERGFTGKFATLTIVPVQFGNRCSHVCNAGDTKLNIFSAHEGEDGSRRNSRLTRSRELPLHDRGHEEPLQAGPATTGVRRPALSCRLTVFEDSEHHVPRTRISRRSNASESDARKEHHTLNGGDHEKGKSWRSFDLERETELSKCRQFNKGPVYSAPQATIPFRTRSSCSTFPPAREP